MRNTSNHIWSIQCEFKQGADIWSMSLYPIMDIKLVLRWQTKLSPILRISSPKCKPCEYICELLSGWLSSFWYHDTLYSLTNFMFINCKDCIPKCSHSFKKCTITLFAHLSSYSVDICWAPTMWFLIRIYGETFQLYFLSLEETHI